jgi:hypothetical protein
MSRRISVTRALEPESADERYPSGLAFLAAKVVEYAAGVVSLAVLFGLRGSEYTPRATSTTPTALIEAAALIAGIYFVAFGYLLVSALVYLIMRFMPRRSIKPVIFALTLSATFGAHAFLVAGWVRFGMPSFYLFIVAMTGMSFLIHFVVGSGSLGKAKRTR